MHMLVYTVSNIWICEAGIMKHVSLRKSPTYASYALTPDVSNLRFIGRYTYVIVILRSIHCLVLK